MTTVLLTALVAGGLVTLIFLRRERMRQRAWKLDLAGRVPKLEGALDDQDIRYEVLRQFDLLSGRILAEQERRAWLQSILDRAHDGVVVVDLDLKLFFANTAAAAIFHQPADALRGKRLAEVTREKPIYDAFQAAVMSQTRYEGQVTVYAGVEARSFSLRITPLPGNRAAGVFLDITRLEELERVRQEFLTNVSHELRTPITSITAYADTLLDGGLEDEENNTRFLETIRRNAQRLTNLVEDISSLSAIESGSLRLEPCAVDLSQVVAEIAGTLSPRAQEFNVAIRCDVPPGLMILADPKRFEEVLLNLADNGIKFNQSGGEVCIRASRDGQVVVIDIEDSGIGISSSDLPRIFERFYRADKSRSTERGGTGLGLSIVKHLVRAQGAQIEVESQPARGSRFTLRWPVFVPEREQVEPEP
ncbi:MAG: PAS domain-containing protein [Acidobacteria bacterium]|nr:PAS domain-containing protein [Acidobacteriota bacterium]